MSSARTINHEQSCVDCNAFDTLLIGLDCQHSFCLVCLSYLYLKCRSRGEKNDQVACSACDHLTKLGVELVQTVNATIRGSLVPNLNMMSQTLLQGSHSSNGTNSNKPFARKQTPSDHGQEKRDTNQKLLKKLSDGTTRGDQQQQQQDKDKESTISARNFFIDSPNSIAERNIPANAPQFCKVHSFEQMSYVCLSCEEYALCSKCVNSKHKNHNVQSFGQAVQQISEWMNIKRHRNQQKIQVCQMRERKLGERKLMVKSKWQRVKEQITDCFEQLRMKAKKRETELVEQCDEHYRMLQQSIQKELQKLTKNLDSLRSYKGDLRRLSNHDIFVTDKKTKVMRAIQYFKHYDNLKDRLGDNTIKIRLQDSLKDNNIELICYLSLSERELIPVYETINLICLSEVSAPPMLTQPDALRMMVPDKYTSLNSSHQRTKRTLKTQQDSSGMMSKRRTQQILETYDRLSHKKGIDKMSNYPSHISKFFDKQTVYGQKITFNDTDSMYSIAARSKAASTKLLSKTNGIEGLTQPKTKKQLNLTKEHIQFRTVPEDLGSPHCLLNYKTNNIFESKRKKVFN